MAKVVIVYEHKAREKDTVLLLQYELKRRNYDVEIFQINELNRIQYLFKKVDLIITPFLYDDCELKEVFGTFGRVNRICNLQWEQIYNGACKDSHKRTPKNNAKYATHICWGMSSYNRLMENGCCKAVLTGAPQMDFLKNTFREWYLNKNVLFDKYGVEKENKTLLFISSFSYLGLSDERLEEIKSLVDFDPYYFRDLTEKTRDIILCWFERLLNEHRDINIIYRPHPGEIFDNRIESLCNKYKNLYFIDNESVSQWIVRCDVILNWYSTAGVEAFFAGKNNIFLRPIDFPANLDYEMFDKVCTVTTYDDFIKYIFDDEIVSKYYTEFPLGKNIEPYYLIDNVLSFMKIADTVENILKEKEDNRISSIYHCTWRLYIHFKYYVKLIIYRGWKSSSCFATKFVKNINRLQSLVNSCEKKEEELIDYKEQIAFKNRIKNFYKSEC